MDDLTITTIPLRDGSLLRVSGALSIGRIDALLPELERIEQGAPRRLVVDLSSLGFLSNQGLGRLIALCDGVEAAGGRAFIVCRRPGTLRMLLLCRADLVATIVPTLEDAMVGVGLDGMLGAV